MKVDLAIKPGVPTANGVVYPADVLEKAFKEWLASPTPSYVIMGEPSTESFDMRNVFGVCENITKEGDGFTAEIRLLTTPMTEEMLKALKVKTACIGQLDEWRFVSDMKLLSLYVDGEPKDVPKTEEPK
jgi:hypothetical protein